ncbi:peptidoglycan binding domain-containing protein [Streptomyces sp. NPDC047928]|uniref:peptidoglycan binding domain-containing protein n=1 Tax=unclassified Streptomyces TaxID=2593676 RepID=UPI0037225E0F
MSRETDSSSSGPQGRGGAAYPSGTPPYGTPVRQEAAGPAVEPDEPKTETTLTTRIRINIPGSRPIPPVVVRKPVGEADAAAATGADERPKPEGGTERTGSTPRPQAQAQAQAPAAPAEPQAPEKPTSDWFAPRKAPAPSPPAATAPAPAAPPAPAPGAPGPQGAPQGGHAAPGAQGAQGEAGPQDGRAGQGTSAMPYFSDAPQQPSGPTTGPMTGGSALSKISAAAPQPPRMSDDTAVLTPQNPAAQPPVQPPPQVSGDTLTSGIPVVPADHRAAPSPFPMSGPAQVASEHVDAFDDPDPYAPATGPQTPAPAPEPARAAAPAPRAKKKGRSKLVLLGVGLVTALGIAYGAGLLMNQSDVPKGTTVLGVDIGGGTKEEAVQKLDAALGKRATTPLRLSVGGVEHEMAPDKAGLSLDSQETVRAAAGSDYNPMSVIGSLFGGERIAQPKIPVDEEKLSVALADLAGSSGSATDGTIRFEPGKVTAVPGRPGRSLDVARSMISVRDAYRAQVETGRSKVVELPIATQQPTITQAELDRAMREFAKPAMSDLITIKAGGKQIQFGPQRSLPKILSMKPIDGRLVEVYDKKAIEELLDGVFDGIKITKGDGKQYQVSADDVASAMQKALLGKTPAERTVTIELNPQG